MENASGVSLSQLPLPLMLLVAVFPLPSILLVVIMSLTWLICHFRL